MPKNIFLSLILTTVDRINQTKHLIQTIEGQKFDLSKIQLIVIDQSNINLEKEVNTELKNIVFVKSNKICHRPNNRSRNNCSRVFEKDGYYIEVKGTKKVMSFSLE